VVDLERQSLPPLLLLLLPLLLLLLLLLLLQLLLLLLLEGDPLRVQSGADSCEEMTADSGS
jgi:hypothetical protein